jgi:Icc-related predicted phosphoesterase
MRIYYTTDIHGSTLCFRKFLNAGKFYSSDVAIVGGDITGKLIIPIVEKPNGTYTCTHQGTVYDLKTKDEVEQLGKKIEDQGYYPYTTNEKEMENFGKDKSKVDELFTKLMVKRVEEWVALADERLKDKKFDCYVQPGNDDRYVVDSILDKSKTIINPDGKVIQLDRDHEMISSGHANITPWDCPRDEPEEKLEETIEKMVSQVKNMQNCIFNFHCPPYDTYLDKGPKLDENLKPLLDMGGGIKMIPVGSPAIRKAIDKYQPLLGLHGHIHESKASQRLGRTLILNPGSEYGEAILRGAIVELSGDKVKNHIFVQG